ncbi:Hypothetical protein POVN_LOCUS612 [uncultured virus]|nr:Hypothetical protein POVN_LOCUS612 [uncultured virus]
MECGGGVWKGVTGGKLIGTYGGRSEINMTAPSFKKVEDLVQEQVAAIAVLFDARRADKPITNEDLNQLNAASTKLYAELQLLGLEFKSKDVKLEAAETSIKALEEGATVQAAKKSKTVKIAQKTPALLGLKFDLGLTYDGV